MVYIIIPTHEGLHSHYVHADFHKYRSFSVGHIDLCKSIGNGETPQLSQLKTSYDVSNISLCFDPRVVRKGIVADEVAMRVVSEYFSFHLSLSFINVPYSYFINLKPTPYMQLTASLNKTVKILFFHQLSPLSSVALFLK